MKKLFTLFSICISTFISQAQTYVGDITLLTQEEVDNFSTNYPGITYVEGTLTVGELFDFEIISDLSGLIQLTGARDLLIGDELSFSGWIPTNVENLTIDSYGQNVINSGGSIELESFTSELTHLNNLFLYFEAIENPELGVTLFENLVSVDSLVLSAAASPITFPSLETINYLFYEAAPLYNMPDYYDYHQMPNLTSLNTLIINSYIEIGYSTPIFPNLNYINFVSVSNTEVHDGFIGLSSLTSIGTFQCYLTNIYNNLDGLSNIQTADVMFFSGYLDPNVNCGLESLESVGRLSLEYFDLSMSCLSNLQEVDTLEITWWEGLTSLSGIENLTINNYLSLSGANLSFCSVPSVCNFISTHTPEDYFIDVNNPFGCSTDVEVLSACGNSGNSAILGGIYFDSNCNGVIDDNEFTISPSYLEVSPDSDIFLGQSNFYVSAAPQTIVNLTASNLPNQYAVGTPVTITTSQFGGTITNQNILVCPAFDFNDLRISILQFGNLSPGFSSLWKLQVDNIGTSTIDFSPSLTFNTPEFIASVIALQGTFMNDMISWTAASISPGQTLEFDFNITLLPTATILGEMFSATASADLMSGTDENPSDNTALFEQEIIGSYDPNDKWVNTPQINIETIDPTQPLDLTYRVRFQNTGTAPAVNVRVEDVLEEDLDPSTFQLISSTHEVYYQIEGDQINFFFNDIMLPDSTSDPEGSIGTFFFRIKSNGNHTLQSSIDNQVSIFFDFNEPIITNVASTIFYNCPEISLVFNGSALVATEGFASYQWTLNGNIIEGENGNTISAPAVGNYVVSVTNEFGCADESDVVEVISAINEVNNTPIALWPNPANDVLNIQTAYRGIINIIDMQGKQVMSLTLNGQSTVDVSGLTSGLYQLVNASGSLGQFIKE